MKISELKIKLKQGGCYVEAEYTRHEWWYSPKTGKHFPVPRHNSKEIKAGTLNKIYRLISHPNFIYKKQM